MKGSAALAGMDKRILAALVAAATLLGGLAAYLALRPDGEASASCQAATVVRPDGGCARQSEACYTYFNVKASETVRCTAESADGRGILQFNLDGGGRVDVKVRDASGRVVYERSVPWSGRFADVDDVRGSRGTWTIETTYVGARGGGTIHLWG